MSPTKEPESSQVVVQFPYKFPNPPNIKLLEPKNGRYSKEDSRDDNSTRKKIHHSNAQFI